MKKKTRLILLTIIGALIVLLVALGLSYAYMHNNVGAGSHSKLGANSCAKILLMEKSNSINLTNSYPMSENAALNTDPYSFGVRSTCSGNRGFKLYIVTIVGNTISANNIKYALTPKGEKEIITTGIVGQLSSGSSDFNTAATNQLSSKVGTVDSIYYTYEDNIALGEVTYYDLYMWVDSDATNSVANQTFTAAVTVLEGDYNDSDISIRLAGNINTYDADVSCSGATGTSWNPLNRSVEALDISAIPIRCIVTSKNNTNLGNLKSIVESNGYEESGIGNYTRINQSDYNIQTPFYTSSWSTTVTSGTDESGAISWDSTNNYWVTNPAVSGQHYYYLITVSDAGYYKLCFRYLSGGTSNRLYRYKNTTNMYTSSYVTTSSTSVDICLDYGIVNTTDTIRLDQYTYNATASLALYLTKGSDVDAGYRYEGEDPNNYVWFNNELWRIIGSIPTKIDSGATTTITNLVKIIRENSIGGVAWHTSSSTPNWGSSSLYNLLNSYYYGAQNATDSAYCYSNGVTSKAECDYRYKGIDPNDYYGSMVKEVYWNTGKSKYTITASSIYGDEITIQTTKGFVALMNASDYGFATSYNRPNRTTVNSYNTANYTSNNWLTGRGFNYTLTPYTDSYVICIGASGEENANTFYMAGHATYPVVYLDSTVYVVSGDGTRGNPYKLGM